MKKATITQIQKKLWELCKQLTRETYGNVCYTCGAVSLIGSNWHTGHMIPKGSLGAYLKYDVRLLRPQCYNCNINLGGMGAVFIEKMRRVEGNRYVNQILKDRQKSVKAYDWYLSLITTYQNALDEIKNDKQVRHSVLHSDGLLQKGLGLAQTQSQRDV